MTETHPDKPKWYFTKRALIVAILSVGPFALPLLWFNPRYSMTAKVVWSVLILGVTLGLGVFTGWLFKVLMAQLGFPQQT